jgi:hypothetical protein
VGSGIVGILLDLQAQGHSLDIAIRNHRFLPSITQPVKPTKPEHCHAQRSRKVENMPAERKMKVRRVGSRSFMFTLGAHEVCLNRELNASTPQGENRGSFRDGHFLSLGDGELLLAAIFTMLILALYWPIVLALIFL